MTDQALTVWRTYHATPGPSGEVCGGRRRGTRPDMKRVDQVPEALRRVPTLYVTNGGGEPKARPSDVRAQRIAVRELADAATEQ